MIAPEPSTVSWLSAGLDTGSALLGIAGTYLMARRYTSNLGLFLVFALLAPVMFALGKGEAVRSYYQNRMLVNRNVPIANTRMVLGLSFLCWAFFLQLVRALAA